MYRILGYFKGIFVNFAFLALVAKIDSAKVLLCHVPFSPHTCRRQHTCCCLVFVVVVIIIIITYYYTWPFISDYYVISLLVLLTLLLISVCMLIMEEDTLSLFVSVDTANCGYHSMVHTCVCVYKHFVILFGASFLHVPVHLISFIS